MPHSKPRIYYSVSFGLQGGYMPNSYGGVYEITTRRQLADMIRGELENYELPLRLFNEVGIRDLWPKLARWGGSNMHFDLCHGDYVLSFCGLTTEEFNQAAKEQQAA